MPPACRAASSNAASTVRARPRGRSSSRRPCMPRRGKVIRHRAQPDAKYNSLWVQTMINKVMKNGKKSVAERIVYEALDQVGQRTKEEPRHVFEQAMRNAM